MACNTAELRTKDVITADEGRKLGFITDFEIDTSSGRICTAIVTPCRDPFFFRFGEEYRIPWDKISCIGEDAVIVCPGEWSKGCQTCSDGKRRRMFGWFR
ncbi:MAG: YlmC/YmxH family sporulation protein [Ruminococcaceae bacterium]|nr:YlmC/YmxH family sporulation protein [Oscillospiraceae bacterium]